MKKQILFDLYSKNLEINSNLTSWFICPLCHQAFNKQMLDLLTIEHVIPESLGGRLKTITCKKCNNNYGSKYIAKLIKNLRIQDILSGKSNTALDAELSIEGKSITVNYDSNKDVHSFLIQDRRSNPEYIKYFKDKFKENQVRELNLNLKLGYEEKFEKMAILIIGYLMLFRYFGRLSD